MRQPPSGNPRALSPSPLDLNNPGVDLLCVTRAAVSAVRPAWTGHCPRLSTVASSHDLKKPPRSHQGQLGSSSVTAVHVIFCHHTILLFCPASPLSLSLYPSPVSNIPTCVCIQIDAQTSSFKQPRLRASHDLQGLIMSQELSSLPTFLSALRLVFIFVRTEDNEVIVRLLQLLQDTDQVLGRSHDIGGLVKALMSHMSSCVNKRP